MFNRVRRFKSLPLEVKVHYVGETKNLRRRWVEHASPAEPNPLLYGIANTGEFEFWWTELPAELIKGVERELIKQLNPPANRLNRPDNRSNKKVSKARGPPVAKEMT